jgi:hypothetical protein
MHSGLVVSLIGSRNGDGSWSPPQIVTLPALCLLACPVHGVFDPLQGIP